MLELLVKIVGSLIVSLLLNNALYFLDRRYFNLHISKDKIKEKSDRYNSVGLITWLLFVLYLIFL